MKVTKRTLAGIACSCCCALCVGLYLVQTSGQVEQARADALARFGGEQVEVCVATRDLVAGEVVSTGDVAVKLWVTDLLPEGAVLDSAEIVGHRLGSDIYCGEVICARRTEVAVNEFAVPQGMAALSVPARSVQAVGGSVEPGMAIDVYATGPTSTTRLVRNALVLATSSGVEGSAASGGSEWLTLAVEPQHVQELVAAAQNLNLYFVLPSEVGELSEKDDATLEDGEGDEDGKASVTAPSPENAASPAALAEGGEAA